MFQQVLEELGFSADVEASAPISTDGLMIALALPQGMDEDRVGAMSVSLLSLGDRGGARVGLWHAGARVAAGRARLRDHELVGHRGRKLTVAKQNAKLGLLFLDIKRAAESAVR